MSKKLIEIQYGTLKEVHRLLLASSFRTKKDQQFCNIITNILKIHIEHPGKRGSHE